MPRNTNLDDNTTITDAPLFEGGDVVPTLTDDIAWDSFDAEATDNAQDPIVLPVGKYQWKITRAIAQRVKAQTTKGEDSSTPNFPLIQVVASPLGPIGPQMKEGVLYKSLRLRVLLALSQGVDFSGNRYDVDLTTLARNRSAYKKFAQALGMNSDQLTDLIRQFNFTNDEEIHIDRLEGRTFYASVRVKKDKEYGDSNELDTYIIPQGR